MSSTIIAPAVSLIGAIAILTAFAVQYPLSSSFPAGGDAADYVESVRMIIGERATFAEAFNRLRASWYPASHLIFASSSLLPLSWPDRFMWWMALGHISCGLALGFAAFRLGRWPAAAVAICFWSLTTTGSMHHFEDGTLAQLWSLTALALLLERIAAKSIIGSAILFAALPLFHPITGLVALFSMLVILPSQWLAAKTVDKGDRKQLVILTCIALLQLFIALLQVQRFANITSPNASNEPLINIFVSGLSPVMLLSLFGIIFLPRLANSHLSKHFLASLYGTSLLLAGNDILGINVWTGRLRSIFILAAIPLASIALVTITRYIHKSRYIRAAFISLLICTLAAPAWQSSSAIYAYYENPKNYARLHPNEYTGIQWMKENLNVNSVIVTGVSNRHSEWIPALTELTWKPTSNLNTYPFQQSANKNEYVVLFTAREDTNPQLWQELAPPLIYQNTNIRIYELSS